MSDAPLFHAYIIGGSRTGAREYIEALLESFDVPRTGMDYAESSHVSFAIDNARTLRAWQELSSAGGGRKVHVIYTDFITREAENALLKTLEEPVPGTHIIFAVPKPDVLLPTLLSRVRVVMPAQETGPANDAKKFLALSRAERLAHIAKLVEKSDEEEAAAEVRERTLALLDGMEKVLALDMQNNPQIQKVFVYSGCFIPHHS